MTGTITGESSDAVTEESSIENQEDSQPEHITQNKGNHHSRNRDGQMTDHPYAEQSIQYQGDSQEEGGLPHSERDT